MIRKVDYISKEAVEKIDYKISEHPCLISISEGSIANIKPVWDFVLRLSFHDIDIDEVKDRFKDKVEEKYVCFNETHAKEILYFLSMIEGTCDHLIVHCKAGISRSAAVAKFVAEKYDIYFNHHYSLYNKKVYTTLRKVFRDKNGIY